MAITQGGTGRMKSTHLDGKAMEFAQLLRLNRNLVRQLAGGAEHNDADLALLRPQLRKCRWPLRTVFRDQYC